MRVSHLPSLYLSSPPILPAFFYLSLLIRHSPNSTLFPYTTLFRSHYVHHHILKRKHDNLIDQKYEQHTHNHHLNVNASNGNYHRSEEHTSELQSRFDLVCRLLLEKKKKKRNININNKTQHKQKNTL